MKRTDVISENKRKRLAEANSRDSRQPKLSFAPVDPVASAIAAAREAGAANVKVTTSTTTVDVTFPTSSTPSKSFTAAMAAVTSKPKPARVASFADRLEAAMQGVGDSSFVYLRRETPLASKGLVLRGRICELVIRRVREARGDTVVDPEGSLRVNGTHRGASQTSNDFDTGDERKRVEVKTSRMTCC
eukprot:4717883-Prymnesium_polylepis.1